MSTAAGIAIGLSASALANSTCDQPMSDETATVLAAWIVGIVLAAIVGYLVGLFVEWQESKRSRYIHFEWSDGLPFAGFFALAWCIGAPVVMIVVSAFGYLFFGGQP